MWVRLWASIPKVIIQSPFSKGDEIGTGRWAHLSGGEATLLSSHAGRFRRPGVGKKHAVHEGHPAYEPNPRTTTSLTLTLTPRYRRSCRSLHDGRWRLLGPRWLAQMVAVHPTWRHFRGPKGAHGCADASLSNLRSLLPGHAFGAKSTNPMLRGRDDHMVGAGTLGLAFR